MADALQDDYVYSRKPAPSLLAVPHIDEDAVRADIRETLDITKGCVVELVMKDNHTLGHNPDNIVRWVRIAREEIERRSFG
jgi:chloramphenicol 3-O-phosphotransferase